MLSFFRTNQLAAGALLIFYAAILHLSSLLSPDQSAMPAADQAGILGYWLYPLTGTQGLLPTLLTIVLLSLQAVLINVLVSNHRLASEVSLFPGLFYILIASSLPSFLCFSPIHLANTFLLIALGGLMNTYKQSSCADLIFNVGLWMGVASLFYPPFILLFFVGMAGLNVLRAYKIRERLMLLAGMATPYLLTALYCFWNNELSLFLDLQIFKPFEFWSFAKHEVLWEIVVELVYWFLLILIAIGSAGAYDFKMQLQVQKKISILYWALLFAGLSTCIQKEASVEHLLVTAAPLGIMISFNFILVSKRWAEMLHLVLLVLILCWQYKGYFMGA
ncbi:MAG: hypothetical protein SGI94_06815 [Saprospiraceae bacterium]|nr:hypothetical protein [Saprospiraceae bacterium]